MTVADNITEKVAELPPEVQAEVMDFVEYLKNKVEHAERLAWSEFSLTNAMRGLEEEQVEYSEKDIKASFL